MFLIKEYKEVLNNYGHPLYEGRWSLVISYVYGAYEVKTIGSNDVAQKWLFELNYFLPYSSSHPLSLYPVIKCSESLISGVGKAQWENNSCWNPFKEFSNERWELVPSAFTLNKSTVRLLIFIFVITHSWHFAVCLPWTFSTSVLSALDYNLSWPRAFPKLPVQLSALWLW